jgi:hypothetical protein
MCFIIPCRSQRHIAGSSVTLQARVKERLGEDQGQAETPQMVHQTPPTRLVQRNHSRIPAATEGPGEQRLRTQHPKAESTHHETIQATQTTIGLRRDSRRIARLNARRRTNVRLINLAGKFCECTGAIDFTVRFYIPFLGWIIRVVAVSLGYGATFYALRQNWASLRTAPLRSAA